MRSKLLALALILSLITLGPQAQSDIRITTVAEGLYHPAGMALLPDGGVLIAEAGSGHGERSAGISLLEVSGALGRLISEIPSGYSDGNLINAPVIAVTPDGAGIIVAVPDAQLFGLPSERAQHLPVQALTPDALTRRHEGRGNVFLLHPFDVTFDNVGAPLISDAAGNGLVIETDDGSLSYFHRFAALDNPNYSGGRLEPLPTGLVRKDDLYYVTLFAGCPHVPNSGQLVAIDAYGRQETIIDGLNMPVDVAVDDAGDLWILEYAVLPPLDLCFTDIDKQQPSGRLSRLTAEGMLETVADELHFPGALLPLPDGSLYITEVFSGRLLHLEFTAEPSPPKRYPPQTKPQTGSVAITNLDTALRSEISRRGLKPYPGRDVIEPESELTRLGRDLFFDPILSGDKNISCATCHHPAFAMTDGRVLPIGTGGQGLGEGRAFRKMIQTNGVNHEGVTGALVNPFIDQFIPRNSPTIINSALLQSQFWDGRVERQASEETVHTLEDAVNDLDLTDPLLAQVLFPITSEHEMAGVTLGSYPPMVMRLFLLNRLREHEEYAARFAAVYGDAGISMRRLGEAIAAFERQLIFTAAPWDDYLAGDTDALNDEQKRGALLFFGALNSGISCADCHSGDLFTDQDFHNLLVPQIGPGKNNGESGLDDFGRANVSFDYGDQYRFRTPSLRNVELTAPYFHSGAYRTLADVIWHHADPWRANIIYDPSRELPAVFQDQLFDYDFERQAHSVAAPMRAGMSMSDEDVADLVDFLHALTDPGARDLSHITPDAVPSGLPLDPLPR